MQALPTFLRRAAIAAALAAAILGTRPAPAQDAPPYQVERSAVHTVVSKVVGGRIYQLYVKLPPGYGDPANAGRRYPVLYLTDGDSGPDATCTGAPCSMPSAKA